MSLSIPIRKNCWEEKLKDSKEEGYFLEYREGGPFWDKRIEGTETPFICIFLIGSIPYYVAVIAIYHCIDKEHIPLKYRGYIQGSYYWVLKCIPLIKK